MKSKYFKYTSPEGSRYFQVRYSSTDNGYHTLIITKPVSGALTQSYHLYDNTFLAEITSRVPSISEDEFNTMRSEFLPKPTEEIYMGFYDQWKDYYLAKKKSGDAARANKDNYWDYYEILERNYVANGIYPKRDAINRTEQNVLLENNHCLTDLFERARHNATMDYVTDNL